MAFIFDDVQVNNQIPPNQEPQPVGQVPAAGQVPIFQHLGEDVGTQATATISQMLGEQPLGATRARMQEQLARGAQQLRQTTGARFAPAIGQGAAVAAQQEVEQDIFAGIAETELKLAEQEQAARERGVGLAVRLEQLGDVKFKQRMSAVDMLLQQGGEENYMQAATELNRLFPGLDVDFSRAIAAENAEDFRSGMTLLGEMVAGGFSLQDAMGVAAAQGVPAFMGMSANQLEDMYLTMERQANPVNAMIDMIRASDMPPDMQQAAIAQYQADLTGFDTYWDEATGQIMVEPPDGFTRVNNLLGLAEGQTIKFSQPLEAPNGQTIPPGKYTVVTESKDWEQDRFWYEGKRTAIQNYTYLVDEQGNRTLIDYEKISTGEEGGFSLLGWLF